MKLRLQLIMVSDAGREQVQDVAQFEREGVTPETLGLTLAEGKLILKKVQEGMVQEQVNDALLRLRCCPDCARGRQPRCGPGTACRDTGRTERPVHNPNGWVDLHVPPAVETSW
jgi:hypothetical protein